MSRVAGRIFIRETGFGLRDLTVVLLDVEKEAYSAFSSGELAGKPASALHGLPVRRLGSTVSDARGRFSIEYTFEIEGRARPNLALAVLVSELEGGKECPKILLASCDVRTEAGAGEGYLVAVPKTLLSQAGLTDLGLRGSVNVTWPAGNREALGKVRQVWQDEDPGPMLSAVYREKVKEVEEARAGQVPENGFRLTLPALEEGRSLAFDDKNGIWLLARDGKAVEVSFAGVVAAADLEEERRPAGGIGVVLDEDRGEFLLAVGEPALSLRDPESDPGELFKWRLKRRYGRAQENLSELEESHV